MQLIFSSSVLAFTLNLSEGVHASRQTALASGRWPLTTRPNCISNANKYVTHDILKKKKNGLFSVWALPDQEVSTDLRSQLRRHHLTCFSSSFSSSSLSSSLSSSRASTFFKVQEDLLSLLRFLRLCLRSQGLESVLQPPGHLASEF